MTADATNQPPTDPQSAPDGRDESQPHVVLELLRELRVQRESFDTAQRLAAAERKSERRWKMIFQALVFGFPVLLGVGYFLFFLSTTGFRWGPLTPAARGTPSML